MDDTLLLTLTVLMRVGVAFSLPSWQALLPELVRKEDIPNAVTFFSIAAVISRQPLAPCPPRPHPELYLESIVAGVRYVRHAPLLRIVLQRMVGFVFPASGALALFAFIARREWEYGPGAFGLFMAAYGGGAVVAASFVPRLRRRLSLRGILAVATAVLHWRNFERVKQLDLDPADAESLPPEPGVESASGTLTPQSRVMVSITYRIASEDRAAFLAAMQPLGISRRRTGASGWELVESAELPGLFEERFRVASWEEHLRQHDRITRSDAMAFHQDPPSPRSQVLDRALGVSPGLS